VTVCCRDSYTQDTLHSHSVATITPIAEKTAGALPCTVIKRSRVRIIFAPEFGLKMCKLNALWLFGVAFGFCNLVDHARIHNLLSFWLGNHCVYHLSSCIIHCTTTYKVFYDTCKRVSEPSFHPVKNKNLLQLQQVGTWLNKEGWMSPAI
jgi:hypothetical protein